jgi:hypothetical protein
MQINLNEQQLKNLNVFLARVDLKGSEVSAFNELVGIIFSPAPVMPQRNITPQVEEVEEAKVEEIKKEEGEIA